MERSVLLSTQPEVCQSLPRRVSLMDSDVDVGDAWLIKQVPSMVSPQKATILQKELNYILEHDMMEPCQVLRSSLVTLIPSSSGTCRFFINHHQVSMVTRTANPLLPPTVRVQVLSRRCSPQTRRELKCYLGMDGYYRMFISNFFCSCSPSHKSIDK